MLGFFPQRLRIKREAVPLPYFGVFGANSKTRAKQLRLKTFSNGVL